MSFFRRIEDFVCEHCGAAVAGNGYTNHCPKCLWSKHVDIEPGDRAAECAGLMRPVFAKREHGEWVLTHECERCAHRKRNRLAAGDDFDSATQLSNFGN